MVFSLFIWNQIGIFVVDFNQQLGAVRTQKLVKTLFQPFSINHHSLWPALYNGNCEKAFRLLSDWWSPERDLIHRSQGKSPYTEWYGRISELSHRGWISHGTIAFMHMIKFYFRDHLKRAGFLADFRVFLYNTKLLWNNNHYFIMFISSFPDHVSC